jgi:hypothetical protein
MEFYTDELTLDFTSYAQLSYLDENNEDVILFLNGTPVGYIVVYTDTENDNREYICVNNEMIYLDTIEKN